MVSIYKINIKDIVMERLETLYMGSPENIKVYNFGNFSKNINSEWLEYYLKYNIGSIEDLLNRINIKLEDVIGGIGFVPIYIPSDKEVKFTPRFIVPVETIIEDIIYRASIVYPSLLVSKEGYVYSIIENKMVFNPNKIKETSSGGYPIIRGCNIFNNKESIISIHRFVAFEWIDNFDYINYCVVDHIDGNKMDVKYTNLRWVSGSENSKLSLEQGLKRDQFQVLIRNIDTGSVLYFPSLAQATDYIGRSRITTTVTDLVPSKVWKGARGRFNIKSISDQRSWDEDSDSLEGTKNLNRYSVVVYINGEEKRYSSVVKACELLLHNTSVRGRESFIQNVKRMFGNNASVEFLDTIVKVEKDSIVTNYKTIMDVKESIPDLNKYSKSVLTKYANIGREVDGYKLWFSVINETKERYNKAFKVKLTNIKSNEVIILDSLRKASEFLGRDRNTLQKYINSGKPILEKYKIEIV